jgi:hypothetical protein
MYEGRRSSSLHLSVYHSELCGQEYGYSSSLTDEKEGCFLSSAINHINRQTAIVIHRYAI